MNERTPQPEHAPEQQNTTRLDLFSLSKSIMESSQIKSITNATRDFFENFKKFLNNTFTSGGTQSTPQETQAPTNTQSAPQATQSTPQETQAPTGSVDENTPVERGYKYTTREWVQKFRHTYPDTPAPLEALERAVQTIHWKPDNHKDLDALRADPLLLEKVKQMLPQVIQMQRESRESEGRLYSITVEIADKFRREYPNLRVTNKELDDLMKVACAGDHENMLRLKEPRNHAELIRNLKTVYDGGRIAER